MVYTCREIEIEIKEGRVRLGTHDFEGVTCEQLNEIFAKYFPHLKHFWTDDHDKKGPHRDRNEEGRVRLETHDFEGSEEETSQGLTVFLDERFGSGNKENAMKIVGNIMGMSDTKDLATRFSESSSGDVGVEFYVDDSSKKSGRRFVETEEVKQLIEAGENLIIVLEECYDTDVEAKFGDLHEEDT